jgi:predicted aconitase
MEGVDELLPLGSTLDGDNAALEVAVLTLEEALNALSDDKSFLLVEAGYRFASANDMKKIKSAINKRAKAIEMKMTLSLAQDTAARKQFVNL